MAIWRIYGRRCGSPISVKVGGLHRTPDSLAIKDQLIPYDASVPLEALAEREAVVPTLRLRVQMGKMFYRLLKLNKLTVDHRFFILNFPLPDFSTNDDVSVTQLYNSTAGFYGQRYQLAGIFFV